MLDRLWQIANSHTGGFLCLRHRGLCRNKNYNLCWIISWNQETVHKLRRCIYLERERERESMCTHMGCLKD